MRVCILCENEKLDLVKKSTKLENILTIPLSESGTLPTTHWFCCIATTEEKANKMVERSNLTTIEISEPKEFLEKWNLQIIK
jgi:hypothetical protein